MVGLWGMPAVSLGMMQARPLFYPPGPEWLLGYLLTMGCYDARALPIILLRRRRPQTIRRPPP